MRASFGIRYAPPSEAPTPGRPILRSLRLFAGSFPPITLFQQACVAAALCYLRLCCARVHGSELFSLDPPLGCFLDCALGLGACLTVDPLASPHYASAAPRTRRRLARISALARWIVFVPSASRSLLLCFRALEEPGRMPAMHLALGGMFLALRMLNPD